MSLPLLTMYLLTAVIGITSYLVSRGPDGRMMEFFWAFGAIAIVYVAMAWVTRHQPLWWHIGAQVLLFGAAATIGMWPKPRLDEMAGMLYLFTPAILVGMFVLAAVARLLARWT